MFDRFRTDGRHVRQGALWCTWIADDAAVPPRVAYAVGRTVGGAVMRNRLRRRLRSVLAAEARSGGVPGGWYLIGTFPAAAALDAASLRATVSGLLARIRADAKS